MAANTRRAEGTSNPAADSPSRLPTLAPPQPRRWQLVTSSVLVGLWVIFLAWMAFTR